MSWDVVRKAAKDLGVKQSGQSVEQLREACKHTTVDQNPSVGVASQTKLTRYMQKRGTACEGTPESRIRKGSASTRSEEEVPKQSSIPTCEEESPRAGSEE